MVFYWKNYISQPKWWIFATFIATLCGIIFFGYFYVTGAGNDAFGQYIPWVKSVSVASRKQVAFSNTESAQSIFEAQYSELGPEGHLAVTRLNQLTEGKEHIDSQQIFSLIDETTFYMWTIRSLLVGRRTVTPVASLGWYENNHTNKLALMPWEGFTDDIRTVFRPETLIIDEAVNPLVIAAFSNDAILEKRNSLLWQYIQYVEKGKSRHLPYESTIPLKNQLVIDTAHRLKEMLTNPELTYQLRRDTHTDVQLQFSAATLAPLSLERVIITRATTTTVPTSVRLSYAGKVVCTSAPLTASKDIELSCANFEIHPHFERITPPEAANFSFPYVAYQAAKQSFPLTLAGFPFEEITGVEFKVHHTYSDKTIDVADGVFVDFTRKD